MSAHHPSAAHHSRTARTHAGHARTGTFPPSFRRFPLSATGSPRVRDARRPHWPSLLHGMPSSAPGERGTVSCAHSSGAGDKLTATSLCCDGWEAACSNVEPFRILRCAASSSFPLLAREYLTSYLRVLLNPLSLSLRKSTLLLPSSLVGGGPLSSFNH